MAKTKIDNYVFRPGMSYKGNLLPNAYSLLNRNKSYIIAEATAYINQEVAAGNSPFNGYTYNQAKCERDIGYVLDAYLNDLRYGGNEKTRKTVSKYWENGVSQLDGDRQPEVVVHEYIRDLITDNILTNTAFTSLQATVSQVIDTDTSAEATASTKIDTLSGFLVDVIENGLDQLPALESNTYGFLKIQGNYNLSDFLLISNNTANEIIFNFVNNDTGAVIENIKNDTLIEASDEDFPKYLQTTDSVTTLKLNFDTSDHSSTDDIQIFVEYTENGKSITTTRPYDFGTDAIERMRVAPALSMLDADFEYGLQPTKWSAIGMIRGYPSVYEVPGSERGISSITTDASAGTDGVGQSLITVTTLTAHGFELGDAITIKALDSSVEGVARAEGAFVIIEVPDTVTFRFYAKAKVGETSGDTLHTNFSQLRQAEFYTGANISTKPNFTVVSNGFSGDIITELATDVGSTIIPYDGITPNLGAPLSDPAIPTGAQVTAAITQSSGGGVYITPTTTSDAGPGTDTIDVDDPAGIITDLAFDRGDGTATFVESIAGSTITFSETFTDTIVGNDVTYTEIGGSNINGIGFDATFDISTAGGVYTVDDIVDGGEAYEVGDRILITADLLGGISPSHDLVLVVTSVFSIGTIDAVDIEGTAFDGTGQVTALQPEVNGGLGFAATFDIDYSGGSYSTITVDNDGEAYTPNDIIVIAGDSFQGGSSPTNDATVVISTVDSVGAVLTATVSGTAPDGQAEYDPITSADYTYSGTTGTGAELRINRNGAVYTATVTSVGSNYLPTETLTIQGSVLGGTNTTNDCTITIDNVDGSGGITAVSVGGVAANVGSVDGVSGSNQVGSAATFTVDIASGSYTTSVTQAGSDYGVNQTFTVLGSEVAGIDTTHDLTITITAVGADGSISTVSSAGTANDGTQSYTAVAGTNQDPEGVGATFDIRRNEGTYTVTLNAAGNDYAVGNRLTLLGTELGGQSPLNDIEIKVDTVTTGAIATFTDTYEEAAFGTVMDLYSTVTISEAITSPIAQGTTIPYEALATLGIEFPNAHGLAPGSTFITTVESDDGDNNHNLAAGSFIATDIPATNRLNFTARAPGNIDTGDSNSDPITGLVYPRPDSFFIHRPFDGGVQLGTGGPQHGAQAIRQSKNYIRYQSGKGIMYTTGALFAPSYDLRSVTSTGTEVGDTITITLDDNDHGVQVGGVVRLIGVETEGYNSGPETYIDPVFDYTVTRVIDERTLEVEAQRRLGASSAVLGFAAQMSVVSWHGATVRSGIFDDQNGIFWEYDGTQVSVVQRTSTKQVAGTIAILADDNLVTGTNTRFRDQLKAGDRIVIKGMTHVISHISSQTSMTVTPDFRGYADVSGAKAMLITDKKVKQSEFNMDRLDGTGPSGYDMDEAKMQMIGIQYSWYGAGFIDYMVRGADGNFVFAHRMRNSNVNTEAFMRSGNLPVRYEVTNEGPPGKLAEDMDLTQTTVELEDASFFPTTGTIYIDNEIIRFTGKSGNTLTGCTRGSTLSNFQAGATRTYSAGDAATHTAKTGVILISNTTTPLISHWGSAFITDGGFDEDRGYIFSYTESAITVSTTKQTAFMIRLAPSVSNAITGDLGEQDLLNRAQLLLQGIEITSESGSGGIVVEGILNPANYPINPDNVGWGALTGLAQGGQPSFAQIAAGGSVSWSTGEAATTQSVTASPALTVSVNSGLYNRGSNTNFLWISAADYRAQFGSNDTSFIVGKSISGTGIRANTTVNDARIDATGNYGWIRISSRTTQSISSGTTDAFTFTEGGDLLDRNFAYFEATAFQSSGATLGTAVTQTGGTVSFPPNTYIANIEEKTFGTVNTYYVVTFNNNYSGTLSAGTGTIEFEFVQPPFAQPGETVFSFIAQPGERSTLDLAQLKELTNTTLGGRGTFPNGPDVLAINIYKVSGNDLESNIILRWGEAQA